MRKTRLEKELLEELKIEAGKRGENIKWFKFAKKNRNGGWIFLDEKLNQYKKLKKITERISKKYPNYSLGQIVSRITDLVND